MSVNDEPRTIPWVKIEPYDLATATKLLALLKAKNLDEFISTLHNNVFNIDHYYDAPDNGTLLEIAYRLHGCNEFIKVLVVYGASSIVKRSPLRDGPINQIGSFNSDLSRFDNPHETGGNGQEGCGNQQTYLQYACNKGFVDIVDGLLKMGFDPNEHYPNSTETPLKIAARNGYHKIVSILIDCSKTSLEWNTDLRPALESVLDHIFGLEKVPSTETDTVCQERDYDKCLKCILKRISHVSVTTKMPKPKRMRKPSSQSCNKTES